MIIISGNLVVTPVAGEPLYLPCLGYDQVLTPTTITATTTTPGYPASNLANPSTVDIWRGTLAPTNINGDINPIKAVDYIGLARHNFSSAGISITVQARTLGGAPEANWFNLFNAHQLPDDSPVIYRFTPSFLEDIRLVLSLGTVAPEAAVLYCGKLLTFERGTAGGYTPIPDARTVEIMSGQADDGNYLGRIVTGARTEAPASFHGLTPAWCRSKLRPFLDVSISRPFFFAWAPQAYPQETGYAWLASPANIVYDLEGYGSIDLDMVGIVK